MAHVFISYVEENAKLASWVAHQLRKNGLDPWFSNEPGRITPGDDWQRVLRTAIEQGGYYLPIFTQEWAARDRSVANQELMLAAEEARMRKPGRRWMLPLKADQEPLPVIELGGGRRLSDIHYADVPKYGWEQSLRSLLLAMGVSSPVLDKGEPLAPGFGANARIVGGTITYRNFNIPLPEMDGTSFVVTGGYISRMENGSLIANFRLRAPFEGLQAINEELGLDSIDVASDDQVISTNPARPSRFWYIDQREANAPGMPIWRMGVQEPLRTGVRTEQITGYEAEGFLNKNDQVVGKLKGFVETESVHGLVRVTFDGEFNLQLQNELRPFL